MQPDTGHRQLFATCFAAIVATSFAFILRAMVIDDWGAAFSLSETQKGELLGVGLWPFAISIIAISLVVDRIGFKAALVFAAVCHASGLTTLLLANGYWGLWIGTFLTSLGNGAVEAAVNPAIATAYATDRPRFLNRLHAGWPGGLILGGLLAMALGAGTDWRIKIGLSILPLTLYAVMLLRTRFPVSERIAAGVSFREMLAEAGYLSALIVSALLMVEVGSLAGLSSLSVLIGIGLLTGAFAYFARSAGRPIYVLLVLLMLPLATTELSTDSWISSLMAPQLSALGLQSGWVLIYTSLIVFVLRLGAGPLLKRVNPVGLLAIASALAAVGLYALSSATGIALLAAATLYGVGKSFFWGTSLGVAGDQTPRGGAVTLNMMAGAGMLAAGIFGSVLLGHLQDRAAVARLDAIPQGYSLVVEKNGLLGSYRAISPDALGKAPPALRAQAELAIAGSKQDALQSVAILPCIMLVCYLGLLFFFRSRGGYRPVAIHVGQA